MFNRTFWLMLALLVSAACNTKPAEEAKPAATATPAASVGSSSAKVEHYACPMHPDVTDTKPSECPKCGMKLVLVTAKDGGAMP